MDIQDFTKVGSEVSSQEVMLRKTYNLLAWSFVPCVLGAFAGMVFNPLLLLGNYWLILGVTFAFFYGMIFLIEKNRYSQKGAVLLMVFTFGMGIMLSPVLQYSGMFPNGSKLVALAAAMTAAVFFTMSALARKAQFNNNELGKFLSVGAIVVMVGVVANIFLQLPLLSLTLSGVFVVFSSLMITWQIRNIIDGGEDSHISAALSIFISIYNLFSSILRLLLAFSGNDD
ncbi:Bax inhibitor-1 family protein [Kingella negevensis]|uniref:Modulator of FtsH protease YccA n=1 Tax=Kingella negevensis TaxID=1522312 RepID=A0A238HF30_9NEIS|nr:Bax inhibitor-1 family protein [Kingella negevensis]MDK4680483.1 Bax inhibitor-1 family protein [Kingella negevensis]MDK4681794.1 Bax inhibitor-1 family protein [Kingella negevensis]MDK4685000.1 Bax inhibitor-1 family protein [Kingella negevensis]MDK4689991.1 Bax inhibitor-1 family protein [Kingella negevensis]MDK4692664.1 Bax inhibitor-1 family protein [Kingella negevensis]